MKLGLRGLLVLAVAATLTGCGYHSPRGASPGVPLAVTAAPARVPSPEAVQEVLAGLRGELARWHSLGAGGYPRAVVEVSRIDEAAEAISVTGSPRERVPLGRASAVGVVARAWIEEAPGAPPLRDTGDVRRVEVVGQGADPLASGVSYGAAVRAAARQVGAALGRRLLGVAEPAMEPL